VDTQFSVIVMLRYISVLLLSGVWSTYMENGDVIKLDSVLGHVFFYKTCKSKDVNSNATNPLCTIQAGS